MDKVYKNEESNLHTGHRQRLKAKYISRGADALTDEELLELILFFALPQRDTLPLARALLSRYGSISAMMDSPRETLKDINGINEHSSILLSLLSDMSRLYRMDKICEDNCFRDKEKIARYLSAYLANERKDCMAILCLDKQDRLLLCETVFDHPTELLSTTHIRTVVHRALDMGAYSVAIAHKHADGYPEPSENDISSTNALSLALANVDVKLIEHFVVTDKEYLGISEYVDRTGYEEF